MQIKTIYIYVDRRPSTVYKYARHQTGFDRATIASKLQAIMLMMI